MARAGIVYAGTDDGIVMFSDPGGTGHWRELGHELRGHVVQAILLKSALEVLALVEGSGVQRSCDGGRTWQPLPDEELKLAWEKMRASMDAMSAGSLTLPGKPEVMLATRGTVIARSEDYGASWQNSTITPALQSEVTVMVTADYNEDVVWAGTADGQLLHSTDRGRTWAQIVQGLSPLRSLTVVRLLSRS